MRVLRLVHLESKIPSFRYFSTRSDHSNTVSTPHRISTFTTAAEPKPFVDISDELPYLCKLPLSKVPSSFPSPQYAQVPKFEAMHTDITRLNNALRVASEPRFGEFCTIGVMIDAGSRCEAGFPSGISHFLEKLAFNSTKSFKSRTAITNLLEKYGGMVDCQATKDSIVYAASCHVSGLEHVMKLIAEAVTKPVLSEEEISIAKSVVASDVETLNMKPEPDEILQEWIHTAAYQNQTLGLPKLCPVDNIDIVSRETLMKFMKTYYTPDRMVVSGVGVKHKSLVEICEKLFCQTRPIWDEENVKADVDICTTTAAKYTGGILKKEKDLSNVGLAVNPFPNLAHFVLGLESCSFKDPDFVPFCVLNSLLGGGGSFSAGGPGKGMYTRLYLNVLNRCYWMYNAISFNMAYADTGLFYIHASADPSKLSEVVEVITKEFIRTAGNMDEDEFKRARTQLESLLMMNLEQRPVIFEDICRQVLGHGYRKRPVDVVDEIRRISVADVKRVAERMLSSKVSVVGYGNLDTLPDYEKINLAIEKRDTQYLKTSRYFSWR